MKLLILLVTFFSFGFHCGKEKNELSTDKCTRAILYYTPNCASIKGYIKLKGEDKTYVFQHEIEESFRNNSSSGLEVCIQYHSVGHKIVTAECIQGEVIIIDKIEIP